MSEHTHKKSNRRIPWYKVARAEGRVCRICSEPVSKAHWKNKTYDHLCILCWARESSIRDHIGNTTAFRLGRE